MRPATPSKLQRTKLFGKELVAAQGFEPCQIDPESLVLPLHHAATEGDEKQIDSTESGRLPQLFSVGRKGAMSVGGHGGACHGRDLSRFISLRGAARHELAG